MRAASGYSESEHDRVDRAAATPGPTGPTSTTGHGGSAATAATSATSADARPWPVQRWLLRCFARRMLCRYRGVGDRAEPKAVVRGPERRVEKLPTLLALSMEGTWEPVPRASASRHSLPARLPPAMEVATSSSEESFQALNHAEQMARRMEGYLRHKQLCDVVLLAGDRRIPAHRCGLVLVLSSVSDYFAAMFTSDVREAKQEEVKLEGVEPTALWALVQYAYTGRLDLREDTIEGLLAAACLLQLSPVVEACCGFLMKQLHPSNCLGIRSFADAQGCTDLHKVAHNYTMENFLEVMRNQEFLLLPTEAVADLFASEEMNVPGEETVFQALMAWVMHDAETRRHVLPGLLTHVRLPLLSPQFLGDLESNPLLCDDVECQRLLLQAMKYHLLPERRPAMQGASTRPRKSTVGTMFAVGGMDATKGQLSHQHRALRPEDQHVDAGGHAERSTAAVRRGRAGRQGVRRGWAGRPEDTQHRRVLQSTHAHLERAAAHVHTPARPRCGCAGRAHVRGRGPRRLELPEHGGALGPAGSAVELRGQHVQPAQHRRCGCPQRKAVRSWRQGW
ncbi:kelch-like protein 5 isoform X6 [Lampetra fluviatilis]